MENKTSGSSSTHSLAFDFDAVEMKMISIIQKRCEKLQLCHFKSSNLNSLLDVAWNELMLDRNQTKEEKNRPNNGNVH